MNPIANPPDPVEPLSDEDRTATLDLLSSRFGIPADALSDYRLFRASKKFISIVARDHVTPTRPPPESAGVPILRTHLKYPKLTTAGAMLLGRHADRNTISLSQEEAEYFVRQEDIVLPEAQTSRCTGRGYVLISTGGLTIGVGLLIDDDGSLRLKSLYPGGWSPAR